MFYTVPLVNDELLLIVNDLTLFNIIPLKILRFNIL